ncbi:MAG TPA: hypothetical protein VLI90_03375 [Tepidisphaeraceae bacterium]|nr:hypothetical protein [Tepidisphaeraceae bacterium]
MNTAQILEILKKNIFSVVCAVIAIAAVVATFWPIGGMYAQLKTQADQHASMYSQLQGLITKERKLPQTDPAQTTQDPLTIFPNEQTITKGAEATKRVSEESKHMVEFVDKINRDPHNLLVQDALPNPATDTPRFIFGDLYKLVLSMDPAVSIKTEPKLQNAKAPNIRNDILNAGVPPTDVEITTRKNDIWNNDFAPRVITVNGQPVNLPQVQQDFTNRSLTLPDEMKMEVAKTKRIYIAPDALTMNPNVIANNAPAPFDIWYAQLSLWIQQDVATAIAQANAKSKNILDAPVKHFLKLTIPPAPGTYVLQPNTATPGAPPAAAPVEGGDTQPVPKVPAVSATGRVSNPMYDVVQFKLAINVDAAQVPYVIAMLGQNRLIDVYNIDVVTVDSSERANAGFIYGANPVVQLNLKCETLFMRQWTVPWMPDRVRVAIGVPPVAPVVGGATP